MLITVREGVLWVSSLVGGLFSGALAAVLGFFVVQLIREGLGEPKEFAIPALLLLSIFGTALWYLLAIIFSNVPLAIGSIVSFAYVAHSLWRDRS